MASISSRIVAILALTIAAASHAFGQPATGTPPFGSFSGGPDIMNNSNLNAELLIPVIQKAGRGLSFSYAITYNSSVWTPRNSLGNLAWTPIGSWGWSAGSDPTTGFVTYKTLQGSCMVNLQVHYFTFYNDWYYYDSQGGKHYFGGAVSNDTVCPGHPPYSMTFSTPTTDGSGYTMTINADPSATVYPRSGGSIILPATGTKTVKDRNGNKVTINGSNFYDTLNATTPVITVTGSAPNPVYYKYYNYLTCSPKTVPKSDTILGV